MSVRYALLGLLAQRPRHGYELRAAFEALTGGPDTWEVKPGQVYATLERLARAGLVTEAGVEKEGGPEKHIYALTPDGQAALEEWFYSDVAGEYQRDEFFIKLMVALAVDGVDVRRMIRIQRAALYRELHRFTRQRMEADPQRELALVLFLDKIVMRLEADLRWLDMVEARLDEIRQQPLPQPEPKPRGRPRSTQKHAED